MIQINCQFCDRTFSVEEYKVMCGRRYCSRRCFFLASRKREVRPCRVCLTDFECKQGSARRFCNTSCSALYQWNKEHQMGDKYKSIKSDWELYHQGLKSLPDMISQMPEKFKNNKTK